MNALAESTVAATRTNLLNGKRPLTRTGSGRHEDVLRNKNEPYDISSMGFPLQRNLGEELGLGLLGVERVPLPSQLSTRFLGVQILPLPPAFCDPGISGAATHNYHSA
jgi:hypothetical protein